jgi:DNA modification methylase
MAPREPAFAPIDAPPEQIAAKLFQRPKPRLVPAYPELDIRCGDCLEVMPTMAENSVHMVLTDPPYFLDGLDSGWSKGAGKTPMATGSVGGLPVGMKFEPAQADRLREYYRSVSKEVMRVLKPGGFFLSFSQPRLSFAMAQAVHESGFEVRDIYTWHYTAKAQAKAFSQDHFIDRMDIPEKEKSKLKASMQGRKTPQLRPQSELIVMAQKPREGTFVENWKKYQIGLVDTRETLDGTTPSTVMLVEKPKKDKFNDHLTVKPIKLIEHLIRVFSCEGQTIFDPFLGSGTTAIAAKKSKRNCIGIEINPDYVEIANKRTREEL